jgi:hypothetical protein
MSEDVYGDHREKEQGAHAVQQEKLAGVGRAGHHETEPIADQYHSRGEQ